MKRFLQTIELLIFLLAAAIFLIAARQGFEPRDAAVPAHVSVESSPTGWPDAEVPTTSSAEAGVVAARPLTNYTTDYPTVGIPPLWSGSFDGIVSGIQTPRKVVALTFDDGPSENTRAIIHELNRFGDHATFFWVGSRITTDEAYNAIESGEELANHSWNHPNMGQLSAEEASAEIGLTSARIAQFTGFPPIWFRSPYNRLFEPEWEQVKAHGLLYANYDVSSVDWIKGMQLSDSLASVDRALRPGGIILMHDSPNRPPQFVPGVLQLLHDRGYEVVTLSGLAQMGAPDTTPLRLGQDGLEW